MYCCYYVTCTLHACYVMLHARYMHVTCTLHACYVMLHAHYMHATSCSPSAESGSTHKVVTGDALKEVFDAVVWVPSSKLLCFPWQDAVNALVSLVRERRENQLGGGVQGSR